MLHGASFFLKKNYVSAFIVILVMTYGCFSGSTLSTDSMILLLLDMEDDILAKSLSSYLIVLLLTEELFHKLKVNK